MDVAPASPGFEEVATESASVLEDLTESGVMVDVDAERDFSDDEVPRWVSLSSVLESVDRARCVGSCPLSQGKGGTTFERLGEFPRRHLCWCMCVGGLVGEGDRNRLLSGVQEG